MPRIIRVLCFEEVGFLNEPILNTPIGKFSIRQMIVILGFAGLAAIAFMSIPDQLFAIVIAGSIFVGGFAIFGRKVKTISPEYTLYLILFKRGLPKPKPVKPRPPTQPGLPIPEKELSKPQNVVHISSFLDSPVRIVGLLRDPQTGEPFVNRPFDVFLGGERIFSGVTDENGFFTIFFMPPSYGSFELEIKPARTVVSVKVPVEIAPSLGGKKA
ncbi:MAG TPA: hypothetical protein ENG66_05920 [Thermococcus sp.]|nr:hypothetical protein [Thermococcus sp.]